MHNHLQFFMKFATLNEHVVITVSMHVKRHDS